MAVGGEERWCFCAAAVAALQRQHAVRRAAAHLAAGARRALDLGHERALLAHRLAGRDAAGRLRSAICRASIWERPRPLARRRMIIDETLLLIIFLLIIIILIVVILLPLLILFAPL